MGNKGMRTGQKIKFTGEADQKPGALPGNVIFVIKQKDHPVFTRKGPHLFINKKISLCDALCGTTFVVEHLDGRKLAISTNPGEVITSESIKQVEGEGMPREDNPFLKGNLVVKFVIDWPRMVASTPTFSLPYKKCSPRASLRRYPRTLRNITFPSSTQGRPRKSTSRTSLPTTLTTKRRSEDRADLGGKVFNAPRPKRRIGMA